MAVSGQIHASLAWSPGKEVKTPTEYEAGGLQTRCGRFGEEKNTLPLPGLELRTFHP